VSCVSRVGWLYRDKWNLEWEVVEWHDELEAWKLVPHGAFCAPWRLVTPFNLDADYKRV
jgi:hypothetical protein